MSEDTMETRADAETGPAGQVAFWSSLIELANNDTEKFRKDGNAALQKYRGVGTWNKGRYDIKGTPAFNILYSNVETLRPSIFSATPQPVVQRRFKQNADPNERQIAIVLQRALEYYQETGDLRQEVDHAIDDYLLPGRGTVRVYLENQMEQIGLEPIGEDGTQEPRMDLVAQDIGFQYVHWEDLCHDPAAQWNQVKWVAFKHLMTRDELIERFGVQGRDVGMTHTEVDPSNQYDDTKNYFAQALVWEIWDKEKRRRLFIAEQHKDVLEETEDPYGLTNFYPIPEPLYANRTNETLNPVSDYFQYRKQADELEVVSVRIMSLTRSLKASGIYASDQKEPLQLLEKAQDGMLIPVANWEAMANSGGIDNVVMWWPIEDIANVLIGLIGQRDVIKQQIYEITGISDLFRGVGEPNVTATAERIKGEFGSMRLRARQALVQRFVKDLYVIAAELVAEHADPAILSQITGEQVTPEMMQVMQSDRLRGYAIQVETDSTIALDVQKDKAETTELIQSTLGIMQMIGVALEGGQEWSIPLLGEMALMSVRTHPKGRALEDKLEELIQGFEQQQEQAQQQPQEEQPDPEQQAEQARQENETVKLQLEAIAKQAEIEAKAQEAQLNAELKEAELMIKAEEVANDIRFKEEESAREERETTAKIQAIMAKASEQRSDDGG